MKPVPPHAGRRRRRLTIVTSFAAGALVVGIAWWGSSATQSSGNESRPIRLGEQGLVNPLLEYTVADNQPAAMQDMTTMFQNKVAQEISAGNASDVGVFYEDLNTAHWAGVNVSEPFSPASLLKVPLMITYLKLAEADPALLDQKVLYDGSFDDNAREDIKPLKSLQAGQYYTVDDLLRYMIVYSDNNAVTLLYSANISSTTMRQVYDAISVPFPTSTDDFLGPRAYSRFFRILYNGTYLDQELSEKALELLAGSDFPQGITAGVPEGITVAQKFGEHDFLNGSKELHDCGIVYHPAHPYVLCIMTKGNDFTKLTSVLRDVSQGAWAMVEKQ